MVSVLAYMVWDWFFDALCAFFRRKLIMLHRGNKIDIQIKTSRSIVQFPGVLPKPAFDTTWNRGYIFSSLVEEELKLACT